MTLKAYSVTEEYENTGGIIFAKFPFTHLPNWHGFHITRIRSVRSSPFHAFPNMYAHSLSPLDVPSYRPCYAVSTAILSPQAARSFPAYHPLTMRYFLAIRWTILFLLNL